MSTAPDVLLSAVMVAAANSSGVVLPMPVAALRSTTDAVTRPAPLIAPMLLTVT